MNIDFSLQFNQEGHTASVNDERHIRNLIEQVLFTAPGERVNRPDFGSGLLQLVFQANSPELAATTQFLVQGALQQWLGSLIEVHEVAVHSEDAQLQVNVAYTILRTQERQVAQFNR